jgi:hypothetical protein
MKPAMRTLFTVTLIAALLVGCASPSARMSTDTLTLQARGEVLARLVDARWEALGGRIKFGEAIEPERVYRLADIRLTLRGAQTLACMADLDAESGEAARDQIAWAERAFAAWQADKPYPPYSRRAAMGTK